MGFGSSPVLPVLGVLFLFLNGGSFFPFLFLWSKLSPSDEATVALAPLEFS